MNGDWKVFAKYRWLGPALWVGFGALGVRVVLPWDVTEVKAEIHRVDSTSTSRIDRVGAALEAHLAWADSSQRQNIAKLAIATDAINARSRYDCMKAKRSRDTYGWDLLISAGVKCNDLLGNRMLP